MLHKNGVQGWDNPCTPLGSRGGTISHNDWFKTRVTDPRRIRN